MNWKNLRGEIEAHIEEKALELIESGVPEQEAWQQARREFGNPTLVTESSREVWRWAWFDRLSQDLRYAVRAIRQNKGFASVAVLSLALGIGANTAIFSLIEALLLRPLAVRDPQELVQVDFMMPGAATPSNFSNPLVQALAKETGIFSDVCGFSNSDVEVGRPDAPEPLTGSMFTGSCHQMFGLVPVAGRLLNPDDARPGAPPVVVISDGYWNRRFGRDPKVLGSKLSISGVSTTVVGVSPPQFHGAIIGQMDDLARPIGSGNGGDVQASTRWLHVLARPQPGVSIAQIKARLAVTWPNLVRDALPESMGPARDRQIASTLALSPGSTGWSGLRGQFSQPLLMLQGVVGLILLICCANVANLLLARTASRRREIELRLAIGAGRARVLQQLATESILLSFLGSVFAIGLSSFASRFLVAVLSSGEDGAILLDLSLNWRVLGFIASLTFVTGLVCGILPALKVTAIGRGASLTGATRTVGSRNRLGSGLVIAQVALSLPLLIGAGLFLRTLQNLRNLDAGFRDEGVLVVDVNIPGLRGPQLAAFYQELLPELETIPAIASASLAFTAPVGSRQISMRFDVIGQPASTEESLVNRIGPRYFQTLRTAVIAGRDFASGDTAAAPRVAIVNQEFVRRHLQDLRTVGQRISVAGATDSAMEIVGIVQDAAYSSLREPPAPIVYTPLAQTGSRGSPASMIITAHPPVAQAAAAVRSRIQVKSPGSTIRIETLSGRIESSLVRERLAASLAEFFGALALVLSAVGLYGLLAYNVARRTSEMGIRLALGAERREVLWMIASGALKLILTGLVIGLPAALAASRLVSSLLFGLPPNDPGVMVGATALLLTAGLCAAMLPAYRASRVDPMVALRHE